MGYVPSLDAAGLAELMKPAINLWKNQGYCIIIDPSKTITITNIVAGTNTVLQFPLGSGPTRIQQLKRPLTARNQTNDTTNRVIEFWLDFPKDKTIPDMRPGLEIVVTNGGNDPYSINYQYVVSGATNSTIAWQRTIQTTTNMEMRPNYQWAFLTGTIVNAFGPLSGVAVTVQYQVSVGVWVSYTANMTYDGTYRVPVFMGTTYRLTFSKAGYSSQTTAAITPIVFTDTNSGNITLS